MHDNASLFRLGLLTVCLWLWLDCAHAGCAISVQKIAFGAYDSSSTSSADTIAEITLSCDGTSVPVTLLIGPSQTSGTVANRRMHHAFKSDTLAYNLFQDQSATQVWGDGAGGSPESVTVNGSYTARIFARIYPRQDVWVGEYSDSVVLTLLP